MGYFSWKTSDTDRSISNRSSDRGTFPVYVLCPDGTVIREDDYDGYGRFGGRDVYALVAQWNLPERCKDENGDWLPDEEIRGLGIDIACYDDQNAALEFPIKIVEDPSIPYEEAKPSVSCPHQGYFYGWDDEEDEDCW